MLLYIAEKPSLGRAIAQGIGGSQHRSDGYITLENGDIVSWCIGHLLEQVPPDKYDVKFKSWRSEHLPIIPGQWQLQAKTKTKKQLSVLRKLVKQADAIVNAGDPDREGQLLVDEVIIHLGIKGVKRNSVRRLLVSDLNPAAVRKSLAAMRSNLEFQPLSESALARSRADWLFGMNMTRAYTLAGQRAGFQGVLSVGRVQTPLLGLVVNREHQIENFQSVPFYDVWVNLITDNSEQFVAKWKPSEACSRYQDSQGRVIYRKLAQNVIARTTGQAASVIDVTNDKKALNSPLPYNLSTLQIDAAKQIGLSAKQVLDAAQSLYEKHQLITYPRSDNRYLPLGHFNERERVLGAISANDNTLTKEIEQADSTLKSKAWNDKKVEAHHAIIPTSKQANLSQLTGTERKLYRMIAMQYIAQFYPPHRVSEQIIEVDVAGGLFIAKTKKVLDVGWKALFKSKVTKQTELPLLSTGQPLTCIDATMNEKMTQPPKSFTDASLLGAMTGISRFVNDPKIKKVLKETDGLGTEATRASIIELLFKRQFLYRDGKLIKPTPTGFALINALPLSATTPDMTALWEAKLNQIAQKELAYVDFMQPLEGELAQLMSQADTAPMENFIGLKSSAKPKFKRRRKKD